MKQRRSVLSLAVVFAVIFVVLISSFFVAAETNHDCTGEDCPICYEISVCQETVRKLTFACAVFAAIYCYQFVLYCRWLRADRLFAIH